MKRFADLYARLDETRATSVKLAAMRAYFAATPPIDAAWGLYFLLGNRLKRVVPPSRLRGWIGDFTGLSAELIEESYSHVGDLAETIALLIDAQAPAQSEDIGLAQWVERLLRLKDQPEAEQQAQLFHWWRHLPLMECFLLNKLLTGSLRVGVSSGLAARALAEHASLPADLVAHRLMGEWLPSAERYAALIAAEAVSGQRNIAQPYPFCLAHALDDAGPQTLGAITDYFAEWKWDGIRGQLIRRGADPLACSRQGEIFLWSRGEELLNGRFPEVEAQAAQLPDGSVLDGELLAWRDGQVLPFALLQTRIGRKNPGKKSLADAPVAFLAYDLLELDHQDLRQLPLLERRQRLDALCADTGILVSPRIEADDWSALAKTREQARTRGVEGLMLKRVDAPYLPGRKTGLWWKWKTGALTVDCVLIYAQAGHGRRSNLYTDYTLAVWDGEALVPVAKAYSGLTDAELLEMDRWIRAHTREKFGPVRSVEPVQVFEIAFEGIQASPRHKSGVALRFPRIARWRRDKGPGDADSLANLSALL